uniref:Secreted protein n=1 Tax=Physcomitrium patens TaxID=3218 RepID=A0A2K1JV95_PHYPA|nr:hypothetical protein PHYPA_015212 [Physcomitrium patens]
MRAFFLASSSWANLGFAATTLWGDLGFTVTSSGGPPKRSARAFLFAFSASSRALDGAFTEPVFSTSTPASPATAPFFEPPLNLAALSLRLSASVILRSVPKRSALFLFFSMSVMVAGAATEACASVAFSSPTAVFVPTAPLSSTSFPISSPLTCSPSSKT